ncbi:MAG: TRAP transporter large permease [Fusobacterium sp.]|uniref:TRAP transporter large permease n=1 Tax=Fusobacterium sp. TaxID=68766 RepID=UPI002A75F643|nr:TRAP transporter large permease [Fusobacterium sp.]MDY3059916.1 TRAP transporter large permease [Fusobacterium sp.]
MIGIILFGALGILLAIGVPIAMSLGIAATVALISSPTISVSIGVLAQRIFAGLESTSIMAIAFFVLAGNLMTKGGISRRIVEFANSIVGNIRGGMSLVLILACAFFAALSGSAPATVIAIGVILYEDMVRVGYKPERVAGLLVVSGGLGPVIPPSIIMVVYCTITGASVGDMFKSGMLIGICIVISLVIVVLYLANKEQWPKAEKKISFEELSKSFFSAIPALLLPIIILGGIYSGMLTPTESAAVAVVWSLIAGIFIYKEVKIKDIVPIVLDSAKGSAMILFIIATSTAFSWLFTFSGISKELVALITAMNLGKTTFCIIVAIVLLSFGTFLEGIATAVLMVPVLWPIAKSLGIDVIHFGMIVSISNVIGTMTPPVAVNIFSAASVSKLKIGDIVKGQIPFFVGYVLVFVLIVLFPFFSTVLI